MKCLVMQTFDDRAPAPCGAEVIGRRCTAGHLQGAHTEPIRRPSPAPLIEPAPAKKVPPSLVLPLKIMIEVAISPDGVLSATPHLPKPTLGDVLGATPRKSRRHQ